MRLLNEKTHPARCRFVKVSTCDVWQHNKGKSHVNKFGKEGTTNKLAQTKKSIKKWDWVTLLKPRTSYYKLPFALFTECVPENSAPLLKLIAHCPPPANDSAYAHIVSSWIHIICAEIKSRPQFFSRRRWWCPQGAVSGPPFGKLRLSFSWISAPATGCHRFVGEMAPYKWTMGFLEGVCASEELRWCWKKLGLFNQVF